MNESYFESIFAIFDEKSPFTSILDTFRAIFGHFPIRPVSMIPWLLNWIILWIESTDLSLIWIIFWIEYWVKQYWIEYWMNHFFAKFKHWIEPDRVSNTSIAWWRFAFCNVFNSRFKAVFFLEAPSTCGMTRLHVFLECCLSKSFSHNATMVSVCVRSSPDWSQCGQNWPASNFKYKGFCQSGAKTSWSRASPDHQDELHRLLRHLHGFPHRLASPGSTRDQGKFGLDRFSSSLWESKLVGETDEVKFVSN